MQYSLYYSSLLCTLFRACAGGRSMSSELGRLSKVVFHTLEHVLNILAFCLSYKFSIVTGNTYVSHWLQERHLSALPWQWPICLSEEPHACVVCKHVYSHVCVYEPQLAHLFPPCSTCLRYRDTSVAPGSADVGANAARLFSLNHAGTLQTPCCCCCCSYGLVSPS